MKILFFLLMILSCFIGNAQNFAPIGAKWQYSMACWGNPYDCGYYSFEVIRDTTLLGKSAKVISYSENGLLRIDGQQILYADSDKVYYWMNNDFHLLYDFNAQAGDTLTLKMGPSFFTGGDTVGYYKMIVDSIGFTNISGGNYKTLFTTSLYYIDGNYSGAYWRYFGEIIEKIGDVGFLFGHSVFFNFIDYEGWIRCYEDSVINYKPYPNSCDFITGITESNYLEKITIFPNPANSILYLTFNLEALINTPYHIYDVLGKTFSLGILHQPLIDISNLTNGLYFLNINNNYHFKFIKQ
jgi:hypothetical protein